MSFNPLDKMTTEELLKLLNETKPVTHNHPFINFLNDFNILEGKYTVQVKYILNLYKCTRKQNSITIKQIMKLCENLLEFKKIDNEIFVNINFSKREISKKIRTFKPSKKVTALPLLKKKFENFIKANTDYSYENYSKWFKETRRDNKLTEKEFRNLYKLYFGDVRK